MKLLNDIIPADLYKDELAPVDLQRSILLCQLCPKVDCQSKKLDTMTKESRYQFMFIFDEFSTHQLDEEHMEKLQVVLNWLQLHPNYIFLTSVMKCEGGEAINCEQYTLREIRLLNPQKVFFFTETYSLLNQEVSMGVPQRIFNQGYIELPHPRLWTNEQDYHYIYNAMLQFLQM